MNLTVIAAGAWGTALAIAFSGHHRVTLLTNEEAVALEMRATRENKRYLPGFMLAESIRISTDFIAAVTDADLVVIATPLAGLRSTLRQLRSMGAEQKPLLWVCKGFEAGSAKLPHQIHAEEIGKSADKNYPHAVLTGPTFAQEIARGMPAAVTLASPDADFAVYLANALHSPRLRIYANDDLVGSEVSGAVKNVMAIATGICDGLGLGHNARAALMTRGLAEIVRLGVALGGQPETFLGLAGMGDLVLTCTGDLSRNRRVGLALAAGKKLPAILLELGHVAEGVSTAREVVCLAAQLGLEMPITETVDAILHRDLPAAEAVEKLMSRDPKPEFI